MVAKILPFKNQVPPDPSQDAGGLSKESRMHLRRSVRSRVFESYVHDLHEILDIWKAGEINDLLLREVLHETMNAIQALDVNYELYTHLQRAHIVLLDRVLRAVHELDDPADEGKELTREQEEEIEKKMLSDIDRENHQKGTTEPDAQPAGAGC